MESKSIRVGIVGCGRVAEHHLRFLAEHPRAKLAALADADLARAQALSDHYRVPQAFSSIEQMLDSKSIDVLHVVTPPALHYQHAAAAIEAGMHVLVEKPVALSSDEVKDLYARAASKNVKLCPDFIQLFHPAVEKISQLIASGRFGCVIHVESFMGVESALPELREWPGTHWSFNLPGGVLHNYRERATASMTVSFAMSQAPYFLKLYCEKGSLFVNFDTMSVVVHCNSRLPRPVRRLFQNIDEAQQLMSSTIRTFWGVLTKRVVPYEGLRTILNRFYASIESGTPPPVAEELVVNTAEAEDFIVEHSGKVHLSLDGLKTTCFNPPPKPRVLVTGASGFVGKVLVRKLLAHGHDVRAYVRPLSESRALEALGVEVVHGDVRDPQSLRRAIQGVESIMHLAAGIRGSRQFAFSSCVKGTENIADLARDSGVKRVIYVGSMAVYDFLALHDGECIREDSPLEPHPELRSTYAHAKRAAEEVAISHLGDRDPTWTIVRPSLIFGPGWDPVSAMGVRVGRYIISLGGRNKTLRLIHVDDVCDALIAMMRAPATAGRILNLSHPEMLDLGEHVERYVKKHDPRVRIIYVPAMLFRAVGWFSEFALRILRRPLLVNRRRVAYLVRGNGADGAVLRSFGIWKPKENIREQLDREVTSG